MANFLAQLVQSGALKQHDPMEAYGNALKMKTLQSLSQNATVDREAKLLEIGKGYLQRVKGPEDYGKYRDYMTKLGMNGDLLPAPESFKDEDDFAAWQMTAVSTAGELLKYKRGEKVKINKGNDDGTTSELELYPDQLKNMQARGMMDGWRLGSVSGTPWKPTERITEESRATEAGKTKDVETWVTPDQKTVNLPKGQMPPDGSVPFKGKGMDIEFDPETGRPIRISQGGMPGQTTAPPKGAQTEVFKDILGGQRDLDAITQIETMYEPEFLTYRGTAKGAWDTFLNKMDPNQKSQFQTRRSGFLSAANRYFLAFRKWATGVAGGEKEMAEIKRATFSEDDSPQDFEAKLQLAKSLTRRILARNKAALKSGVDNQKAFQEYIKATPLDNIPTMQDRGDQLSKQGYTKEQVLSILKEEGYI